jgi:hypothetical protein
MATRMSGMAVRKAFQRWTLAASFAVGQLGALPSRPAAEPYPFVRLLSEPRPGFAPGEIVRVTGGGRQRTTIILAHALDVSQGEHCSPSPN